MSLIRGFICSMSSFTLIPMPSFDYKDGDMRYMMAMFPLVGIVIGAFEIGWYFLCNWLALGHFLFIAGLLLIPIIITGGIHLDGYCDVCDALASHAPMEKKISILKDPHIGAFAAIWLIIFIVMYLGFLSEIEMTLQNTLLISISFVISRCSSTIASFTLPQRHSNGMLHAQVADASRAKSLIIASIILLCALVGCFLLGWAYCVFMLAFAAMAFGVTARISIHSFGGMSGDLAGFLTETSEFAMLIGIVLAGLVIA